MMKFARAYQKMKSNNSIDFIHQRMIDTQVENKLPNQISMFIIERTIFKTTKVLPRSASHRDREKH